MDAFTIFCIVNFVLEIGGIQVPVNLNNNRNIYDQNIFLRSHSQQHNFSPNSYRHNTYDQNAASLRSQNNIHTNYEHNIYLQNIHRQNPSSQRQSSDFSSNVKLPSRCPSHSVCEGIKECYDKLYTCGYANNYNEYSRKINNKRCKYGVCCPALGRKCWKRLQVEESGSENSIVFPMNLIQSTTTIVPAIVEERTTVKPATMAPTKGSVPPVKPNVVQNNFTAHPNFHLLAGPHCGFGLYPRIAFGDEVAPGELPWLAMLRYRENGKLVFRCGGALISPRYVLTAAHCVLHRNKSFSLAGVRLGEINLKSLIDCVDIDEESNDVLGFGNSSYTTTICSDKPQNIKIEKIIAHPNFKLNSILSGYPNDIGLIRLKEEAYITSFVRPICMLGLANPAVRGNRGVDLQNFAVAGWGMVHMGQDPLSNVLRRVNVSEVTRNKCNEVLRRQVHECQLCAGGDHGNTCRGDSGGPLMAQVWGDGDEICPLLVGVVSYGTQDCGYKQPSVFCAASCYLQWILDTVEP